jgi:hypothetical protein
VEFSDHSMFPYPQEAHKASSLRSSLHNPHLE